MDDVNKEAEDGWVSDTEPVERVWAVSKRYDGWQSVDEISDRARASTADTRECLDDMTVIGIVDEEDGGYQVPREVGIALEACRLLDRADDDHIEGRLKELRSEPDPDETTRRNRAVAEVAVAISDAVRVDGNVRGQ